MDVWPFLTQKEGQTSTETSTLETCLHFGMYKGIHIHYVPTSYLRWVLRELEHLEPYLRHVIKVVLEERGEPTEPPLRSDPRLLLRIWRTEMRRRFDDSDAQRDVVRAGSDLLEVLLGVTHPEEPR